ncbi:hypothetical protein EBR44_10255 [bacterium]|nr:hypothetical protein [bacterium]
MNRPARAGAPLSWGSAGALAGLLLVALPVIIHLLGKDPATRRAFPTLRFIAASRLLPTRWSRIHDPLLLAVRCAVLAAAVVALSWSRLRLVCELSELNRRAQPPRMSAPRASRGGHRHHQLRFPSISSRHRKTLTFETLCLKRSLGA